MDGIEQAITSSIAGLSGSESSSADSSATDTAADTGAATADAVDSGESAAAASPQGSDSGADAPAAPAAAAVVEPSVAAEAPATAEETLETLQQELAGKRDNRIPYPRVRKIVENAERKTEARVRQAVEAEVAQYRTPEFQNGITAMRVAEESPEQFLAALAQADPRYADLLAGAKVLAAASGAQKPVAARTAAPQAVADDDVQPDIQLTDGTLGYSADATAKLVAREVARAQQDFQKVLDDRLKPYEPIQKDYRTQQLRNEAVQTVQQKLAAAEKWPGFSENKEAIAKTIMDANQRGQKIELYEAYIQTVIPKLKAEETTVRQKIVAEMNKQAKGSSGVAPGAAAAADAVTAPAAGVDPIEDAILGSIRGLKK